MAQEIFQTELKLSDTDRAGWIGCADVHENDIGFIYGELGFYETLMVKVEHESPSFGGLGLSGEKLVQSSLIFGWCF